MQRTSVTVTVYCSTPGCPAVAERTLTDPGPVAAAVAAARRSIRRRDGWEVAGKMFSGDDDVCPACLASRAGEPMAPLLQLIRGAEELDADPAVVAPRGVPVGAAAGGAAAPGPGPQPPAEPAQGSAEETAAAPAAPGPVAVAAAWTGPLRITADPLPPEWRKPAGRPGLHAAHPAPAPAADATVVLDLTGAAGAAARP